jgi:hypothetical protein
MSGSAGLIVAMLLAAPQAPGAPTVAVTPVMVDIDQGQAVGARRAGMLCLPAGQTLWREVAPAPDRATRGIAAALREAGFAITQAGDLQAAAPSASRYRIVATVLTASISVCESKVGIARAMLGRGSVKAKGTLDSALEGVRGR